MGAHLDFNDAMGPNNLQTVPLIYIKHFAYIISDEYERFKQMHQDNFITYLR